MTTTVRIIVTVKQVVATSQTKNSYQKCRPQGWDTRMEVTLATHRSMTSPTSKITTQCYSAQQTSSDMSLPFVNPNSTGNSFITQPKELSPRSSPPKILKGVPCFSWHRIPAPFLSQVAAPWPPPPTVGACPPLGLSGRGTLRPSGVKSGEMLSSKFSHETRTSQICTRSGHNVVDSGLRA